MRERAAIVTILVLVVALFLPHVSASIYKDYGVAEVVNPLQMTPTDTVCSWQKGDRTLAFYSATDDCPQEGDYLSYGDGESLEITGSPMASSAEGNTVLYSSIGEQRHKEMVQNGLSPAGPRWVNKGLVIKPSAVTSPIKLSGSNNQNTVIQHAVICTESMALSFEKFTQSPSKPWIIDQSSAVSESKNTFQTEDTAGKCGELFEKEGMFQGWQSLARPNKVYDLPMRCIDPKIVFMKFEHPQWDGLLGNQNLGTPISVRNFDDEGPELIVDLKSGDNYAKFTFRYDESDPEMLEQIGVWIADLSGAAGGFEYQILCGEAYPFEETEDTCEIERGGIWNSEYEACCTDVQAGEPTEDGKEHCLYYPTLEYPDYYNPEFLGEEHDESKRLFWYEGPIRSCTTNNLNQQAKDSFICLQNSTEPQWYRSICNEENSTTCGTNVTGWFSVETDTWTDDPNNPGACSSDNQVNGQCCRSGIYEFEPIREDGSRACIGGELIQGKNLSVPESVVSVFFLTLGGFGL